jgi:uncharacterized membrane protein YgcG
MNRSVIRGIAYVLVCTLAYPPLALAQSTDSAPSAAAASAPAGRVFNQEQLDQMLAPVALYPDALLSQMLMASTYPLEVVEADRWMKQHKGLSGTALQDALAGQRWDASVKSLCAFPQVLDRMTRDLSWTQKIGDAFIDQQQQVMDTVQNLREKAQAAGTLRSNEEQQVVTGDSDITIEPTNPQVVYVPTYDPAVVYGGWWWPGYPPYYPAWWGPPRGSAFIDGIFWGVGIGAGFALWGAFNWRRHDVDIHVDRYNRFNGTHLTDNHWHFDPGHRGGVPYRGIAAQERYGRFDQHAAQAREAFRGRNESFGPAPRGGALNIGHGEEARSFSDRGYASMEGGHGGIGGRVAQDQHFSMPHGGSHMEGGGGGGFGHGGGGGFGHGGGGGHR